jgi:uncharacterized membrane protein YkvA (DUF1232 family)
MPMKKADKKTLNSHLTKRKKMKPHTIFNLNAEMSFLKYELNDKKRNRRNTIAMTILYTIVKG